MHVAGGGDEDHRAGGVLHRRFFHQLDAPAVRQEVIQQDQPRLMRIGFGPRFGQRGGVSHHPQVEIFLDELRVQRRQLRLVFHDQNVQCLV